MATKLTRMTRPLRSTRITGLLHYYETVCPRAPRRYSTPCGFVRLGNSLSLPPRQGEGSIGATGSHVPCKSPDQARAAYMPDAIWAVGRLPPDLSRSPGLAPVSTPLEFVTTRHQRFALARLPDPHLTRSLPRLLPQRSPRPALNRRSLRWFEASPCRATPEDLPPSLTQHRLQEALHQVLLQRSWHTSCRNAQVSGRAGCFTQNERLTKLQFSAVYGGGVMGQVAPPTCTPTRVSTAAEN